MVLDLEVKRLIQMKWYFLVTMDSTWEVQIDVHVLQMERGVVYRQLVKVEPQEHENKKIREKHCKIMEDFA